jgi:hypothetical protein
VDIERRYLAEEEHWLQSKRAADLVIGVVWAVLKVKRGQTFHENTPSWAGEYQSATGN